MQQRAVASVIVLILAGLTGPAAATVQAPVLVRNLNGQTGWFAAPLIADLDGDGQLEILV